MTPAVPPMPSSETTTAQTRPCEPSAVELPDAVLWDMDGTLVDTEPYWFDAEREIVEAAGGHWSTEMALDLVGNDLITSAQKIIARTPVSMDPEGLVVRMLDRVSARMADAVPWRPGALELLTDLRARGVRCALVTMSWTQLADMLIAAVPAGTFSAVITGDRVSQGKPHPEPYLAAVRELSSVPGRCIAVEDSVPGMTSATRAGVPTVVVPHMATVPEAAGAIQAPTLAGVNAYGLASIAADARRG